MPLQEAQFFAPLDMVGATVALLHRLLNHISHHLMVVLPQPPLRLVEGAKQVAGLLPLLEPLMLMLIASLV